MALLVVPLARRADRRDGSGGSLFEPVAFSWETFRDELALEIEDDGMLVGVNWSGKRAVGYDIGAATVVRSVEALIEDPSARPS